MKNKVEMGKQYKSSTPGGLFNGADGLFNGAAFRRVLAIDCAGDCPVAIELEDGSILTFTEDGYYFADRRQDYYDLIEVSPYADFKTDERVMISNDGVYWHRRHFDKEMDGVAYCFEYGRTSWTIGDRESYDDCESYPWNFCRRPTEEELKEK